MEVSTSVTVISFVGHLIPFFFEMSDYFGVPLLNSVLLKQSVFCSRLLLRVIYPIYSTFFSGCPCSSPNCIESEASSRHSYRTGDHGLAPPGREPCESPGPGTRPARPPENFPSTEGGGPLPPGPPLRSTTSFRPSHSTHRSSPTVSPAAQCP